MSPSVIGLLILAVVIVLFLTGWIPSAQAAVLGCILFVLTGICSATEVFSSMADSTVILVVGMLIVGEAMFSVGLAYDVGNFIRRVTGNNERRLIFAAGLISALLSSFLSNVTVIAMAISIINSIVRTSKNFRSKQLYLPIIIGASFGGILTLVGSTPQVTAMNILQETTGATLKIFDFTAIGAILVITYLLHATFTGYKLGDKIWGSRPEEDEREIAEDANMSFVAEVPQYKKIMMLVIFLGMIVLFATGVIPVSLTAALGAVACVALRLIGERKAMAAVDWRIVIRLGGCLGIAKGLKASGFGDLISGGFIKIFGDQVSPMVLLAVAVLLVMIISNFITNSTAVVIVLPPVLAICTALGYNPVTYTMAIAYGANLCICTPLASAQMALAMAGGYKFSDYVKYGILLEILVYIEIVALTPLFFPF